MYLWHEVSIHIKVKVSLLPAYDLTEVRKTDFISILKLAVVFSMLLDCIIRQVNVLVSDIVKIELAAARPDIAVMVCEALKRTTNAGKHSVASEIKLALMHEQGVVNILLDYVGTFATAFAVSYQTLHFF